MKKICLFLIACIALSSCKKEAAVAKKSDNPFAKFGINPKEIGRLHNQMLSYANKNWSSNVVSARNSQDDDFVAELSAEEAANFFDLTSGLYDASQYASVPEEDIYDIAYSTNMSYRNIYNETSAGVESDAYTMAPVIYDRKKTAAKADLVNALNQNVITLKEKNFLDRLLDEFGAVEANRAYDRYGVLISDLYTEYEAQAFDEEAGEGIFASLMLEVAQYSYEYWSSLYPSERTGRPSMKTTALPLWVGMDVVGALAGGISSKVSGSTWGEAGVQALVWGAAGSIPATRWFSRLFN